MMSKKDPKINSFEIKEANENSSRPNDTYRA